MLNREEIVDLYFHYLKENKLYNLTSGEQSVLCESLGIEPENTDIFVESIQASIDQIISERAEHFISDYVAPLIYTKNRENMIKYRQYVKESADAKIKYAIKTVMEEYDEYYRDSLNAIHAKAIMTDLKNLFEKYHIEIEPDKVNYCAQLEKNIQELTESVTEYSELNNKLKGDLNQYIKEDVIRKLCPEFSETQINKINMLTEQYDIHSLGLEKFKNQVYTLKMRYSDYKNPVNNSVMNKPQNPLSDAVNKIRLV